MILATELKDDLSQNGSREKGERLAVREKTQ